MVFVLQIALDLTEEEKQRVVELEDDESRCKFVSLIALLYHDIIL